MGYEWSHSEHGALVVRSLLRRLRSHPDRHTLCQFAEGHWATMATHPHAQTVIRVLVSSYIPPRDILHALSESLGPTYVEIMAASALGPKMLEAILMDNSLSQ